jgi:hypothetical protein
MSIYKCKNFGSCSKADRGEELALPAGTDDKCPECGFTLGTDDPDATGGGDGVRKSGRKKLVVSVLSVVVLGAAALAGYSNWRSNQVVVLTPDRSGQSAPSQPPAVPDVPPVASPAPVAKAAPPQPDLPTVNEVSVRRTCDEATKARQADAEKVCRRASAVTLMNSGVQAAIAGNLDQAERDYTAAREKDPDFPELYFNFAVLKAKQNKGSEAIDNLVLASTKGFTQFSAIKAEPALQKLKSNPEFKAKLESLEAK